MWDINFKPAKCYSLSVSIMRNFGLHLLLSVTTLPIEEFDALKVLGVYFDHKLAYAELYG